MRTVPDRSRRVYERRSMFATSRSALFGGLGWSLGLGLSFSLGAVSTAAAEPQAAAPAATPAAPAADADGDPLAPILPQVAKVRAKVCAPKPGQKPGPRTELCQALKEFEAGTPPNLPAKDSLSVGPLWRIVDEDFKPWGAFPLRIFPASASSRVLWFKLATDNVQETRDTNLYLQTWRTGKPDDKGLVARLIRGQLSNLTQQAAETPDSLKPHPAKSALCVDAFERGQLSGQLFVRQKGAKLYALLVSPEVLNPAASKEPHQVLYFAPLPPPVPVAAIPPAAQPAK